jgi:dephospho-CoA kinase
VSTDPAPRRVPSPGDIVRRTIRIGLTGPIGCGKSTVARWLADLGAVVIDADSIARDVTEPGTPAAAAIAGDFGEEVLAADGTLDRRALGQIVFRDPAALARLEAIVHPAVRPVIVAGMAAAERDGAPAVVVEAIKLVEGGLAELCDEVWLVTCSRESQLARIVARGSGRALDRGDAEARIAAQSGLTDRLRPRATRVIETSGSLDATRATVQGAWDAALRGRVPERGSRRVSKS